MNRLTFFLGACLSVLFIPGCTDEDKGIITQILSRSLENVSDDKGVPEPETKVVPDPEPEIVAVPDPDPETVVVPDPQPADYPETPTYALDTTCSAKQDVRWVDDLSLDLDQKLAGVKIVAYKIKWFSGSWSPWYVPGVNDLYQKVSLGEPKRRAWACFNDHTHRYIAIPVESADKLRSYAEFEKGVVTEQIQRSGTSEVESAPENNDLWVSSLLIDIDMEIAGKKIVAYQIEWFSGDWSGWIIPGYKDIYQKPSEEPRRWWACFNDHGFRSISFDLEDLLGD